jgi:hypothetical protein
VSPIFGQRILPPAEELPPRVRDAVAAREDSQAKLREAQVELGNLERVGLPRARQKDIEDAASAIEEQKSPPKPQHEARALRKLDELRRSVQANELVLERATARLDERIAEHQSAISRAAEKRLSDAKSGFRQAVDDLDAATAELIAANALAGWAADPTTIYKQRGGGPVLHGIPSASGDPLTAAEVIAALRTVFEPRPPCRIPSPFAVPTIESEPAPDAPRQPDYAAELAAGTVPAD